MVKPVGHRQELLVEGAQDVGGHRRVEAVADGRRRAQAVAAGVGAELAAGRDRLVGLAHAPLGGRDHLVDLLAAQHALVDQLLGVDLAHRRVRLDRAAHDRLRVGGLVQLVVAEAAVADQVDQHVALVALAVGHRDLRGADAGVHVVGVHVDDRDVEAARQVADVVGRARVVRVGGEPDLVVGDDVDRAAGGVAAQGLEVERLGHDALAGEGRVAVDEHRDGARGVVARLAGRAPGLEGAGVALGDGVDLLEVARVGGELDRDRPPAARDVGALGAQVVLHVAGGLARVLLARLEGHVALELGEDRLGRAPDDVGDEGEASAVGHAHDDLGGALGGRQLDDLVGDRHERVHALDREGLLPEVGAAQEALERVDLDQALERRRGAARAAMRLAEAARLDHPAQPEALLVVGEVLDLVGDRAAVGLLEVREGCGERLARHLDAQDRARDARHDLGRQVDLVGGQRRVARGRRAERVELGGQVAVAAVGLDQRHGGRDAGQDLLVARRPGRLRRARRRGRGGGRPARGVGREGGAPGPARGSRARPRRSRRRRRAACRSRRGRRRSRRPG